MNLSKIGGNKSSKIDDLELTYFTIVLVEIYQLPALSSSGQYAVATVMYSSIISIAF